MSPPQGTQQTGVFLLTALLLLSLLVAACGIPRGSSGQTPPHPSATPTATVPPPPTITADAGWKIVFQTVKDATNLHSGQSQVFKFDQIPPSTSFIGYGTCTGNGSAKATVNGTSADGSSTFTEVLSASCTPSGTSVSVDGSSTGNGSDVTVAGKVGGFRNISDVVEQATISLTITGPIKLEIVVEEPV
jgi:hypothetical protein